MYIKKLINRTLCYLIYIIFTLFSPSLFAKETPKVFIISWIDNQVITNIDLIDRYNLVLDISKISVSNKQDKIIILNQILQKMIDENLQIAQAKKLGISINENKFNQAIAEFSKEINTDPQNLEDFFNKKSISYKKFLEQVKSQVLWSDIVASVIAPKIKVSDAEINELLELRNIKSKIDKFFLLEIFIPANPDDKAIGGKDLAEKLYKEVIDGKNFKDLAKQFSRSPTSEFGGEIGWVGIKDIDDKIFNKIKNLKINQISKPILFKDGYYIFKVNDKKTFDALDNNDLKQVEQIVFSKKLQLEAKNYLMELRKSAYIEIDRKNLEDIVGL